jgi:hypothetical protein
MAIGFPVRQQIVIDPPVSMPGWWSARMATGKYCQRPVFRNGHGWACVIAACRNAARHRGAMSSVESSRRAPVPAANVNTM